MLAAISPVTALRATWMWREETNYGALPDLWIASAVRTPAAGGISTTQEDGSRVLGRIEFPHCCPVLLRSGRIATAIPRTIRDPGEGDSVTEH
jgi:hypothetical protein